MDENKKYTLEHLKLIQSVITRMANNSAQMKTWTVSLVTAVIAFSGLSDNPHRLVPLAGLIAVFAFWRMDAKYLHLERCYIKLYDAVLEVRGIRKFDLNYEKFKNNVDSTWKIMLSWSASGFYMSLSIVLIVVMIIIDVDLFLDMFETIIELIEIAPNSRGY